jgi:hypothetical protein
MLFAFVGMIKEKQIGLVKALGHPAGTTICAGLPCSLPQRCGFEPRHERSHRWVNFRRRPTGKLLVKPWIVRTGLYFQNYCSGRVKNDAVPVAARNFSHTGALRAERNAVFEHSLGGKNYQVTPALEHAHELPLAGSMAVRAYSM